MESILQRGQGDVIQVDEIHVRAKWTISVQRERPDGDVCLPAMGRWTRCRVCQRPVRGHACQRNCLGFQRRIFRKLLF